MTEKDIIQEQAKQAWLDSNRKATIVLGTGGGKSKIAIDLIDELRPKSCLILVNSANLRDLNWTEEFKRFSKEELLALVDIETYQTAYKWDTRHYELIIYDEIDFALTPEYGRSFKISSSLILGLTGFLPKEKEEILNQYAPVCFRLSTQDMQEQGALNKSEIIFVEYPLNTELTDKINKHKGGHFFTSENNLYAYYQREFEKAVIIKSKAESALRFLSDPKLEKEFKLADWKFKAMAAKRKSILHNSSTSVKVVNRLYNIIHSKPGNKLLIFSALTKQCDRMYNPFHGKNENDFSGIEDLNAGKINTLSVAKKINRGTNLVGVNYIIRESYDGSETDMQQIHGRGMRLKPDQTLKLIILVPYYVDKVKTKQGTYQPIEVQTQAYNWAKKSLTSFDTSKSRTIKLDKTLEFPENHNII